MIQGNDYLSGRTQFFGSRLKQKEGDSLKKHPKFVYFQDKAGEWRFNLKSANGKIIAVSEGYETEQGVKNGINAVINAIGHMNENSFFKIEKN